MDPSPKLLYQHDVVNPVLPLLTKCFINSKYPKHHLSSCVIKSCISYHFPYLSIFDILKKAKHAPKFLKINRSDDNSFRAFRDEIKSHFDTFEMNPDLLCDPTTNYQLFEEILLNTKSKHLAPKTVKLKEYRHKLSQWMTNGILNSIKYRDKMFLKLKSRSAGTDLHGRLSAN